MIFSNSPNTFQQKTNDLFQRFAFIHAYIDGIFILTKLDWKYNVQILELNINILKESGPSTEIYFFEKQK